MTNQDVQTRIEKYAYLLSKEQKTFDQLIWQLAEITLRLETGFQPEHEAVQSLAHSIFQQKPTAAMLHWLIADRMIQFEEKQKIHHQ